MKHYLFEGFRLEPGNRLLLRQGEPISLAPKAFDTLVYLVENQGRLVTREELMRAVWPDTFVDTANLTVYISQLRKALGDENGRQYIETVPRKGYRLNAEVQVMEPEAPPLPSPPLPRQRRRVRTALAWAAGGAMLLVAAAIWLVAMPARHPPEFRRLRLTSFGSELAITAAAISPDGRMAAYANAGGLFAQSIDTGEVHPLWASTTGITVLSISWFPDGAKLLVSGYAFEEDRPGLWIVEVMGASDPVRVGEGLDAAVSPDGRLIAAGGPRGSMPVIRIMHSDGTDARTVATGNVGEVFGPVAWASDSRDLLWVRYRWDPQLRRNTGSIEDSTVGTGELSTLFHGAGFTGDVVSAAGRVIFAQVLEANPSSKYGGRLVALDKLKRPAPIAEIADPIAGLSATVSGSLMVRHAVVEHSVFVSDAPGLEHPRRLTLGTGREDLPRAWTPDSRAVVFDSNRNGTWELYRQQLDATTDEPLVHSTADSFSPQLSPDGRWFFYLSRPKNWQASEPVSILRIPVKGGPPEPVLQETGIADWGLRFACAKVSRGPCVLARRVGNQIVFQTFDGGEVARVDYDAAHAVSWTLAPDGSRLAWARWDAADARIHIVPVAPHVPAREVVAKGTSHIHSMHWSADGTGWYVTSAWPASWRISLVAENGGVRELTRGLGMHAPDVFPSPDGRYAAWSQRITESNIWLLEVH